MKNISTVTRDLDVTRKIDLDNLSSTITTNLNNKMDKANPTGTGSFSLNRKAGTTVGNYSFAEGYNTTASGISSHAEGKNTTASSYASHAEGNSTTASLNSAHAEGWSTTASGDSSHAEGAATTASGYGSHAEGNRTTANHLAQHVFGEYNVLDTSTAATTARGNYVEIVGNGTSTSARSNARTLDWSGNEVLAGKSTATEFVHSGTGATLLSVLNTDNTTDYMLSYQNSTFEVGNLGKGICLMGNATRPKYETSTTVEGGVDLALYSDVNTKLSPSNLKAGANITLTTSGNDITINAVAEEGGSVVNINGTKAPIVDFDSDPQTQISNKMDKVNPTGTGSFSLNRKAGTTVGNYSFAEGYNTTASGESSHAEGYATIASGAYSHAEGKNTTASNTYSHAEGYITTASGDCSHAEGYSTTASNYASHAEGYITTASGLYSHAEGVRTTASGYASHAEGYETKASGESSHAEGNETTANHLAQHVFGEYNVLDTSIAATTARGNYVEIVGNGTDSARSNARTLDWSGNEVLAGTLRASGLTDGTTTKTMTQVLASPRFAIQGTSTDTYACYCDVYDTYNVGYNMRICWGKVGGQLAAETTVSYSYPFKTGTVPVVLVTFKKNDDTTRQYNVHENPTATSFIIRKSAGSESCGFYWVAFGQV